MSNPVVQWFLPGRLEMEDLVSNAEALHQPFFYKTTMNVQIKRRCVWKYTSVSKTQEIRRKRYRNTICYHLRRSQCRYITNISFVVGSQGQLPRSKLVKESRVSEMNMEVINYETSIIVLREKTRRFATAVTVTPGELEVTYIFTLWLKLFDERTNERTKCAEERTRLWIYRY